MIHGPRALLAQTSGEEDRAAGECFVTGGPLGRVGQKNVDDGMDDGRWTMDVKESYTELVDETGR